MLILNSLALLEASVELAMICRFIRVTADLIRDKSAAQTGIERLSRDHVPRYYCLSQDYLII